MPVCHYFILIKNGATGCSTLVYLSTFQNYIYHLSGQLHIFLLAEIEIQIIIFFTLNIMIRYSNMEGSLSCVVDGFFTLNIILQCGRMAAQYSHCFGLLILVALIPLSEFSNPITAKKYGAKPDAETLDLLNTVAQEKEVITQIFACFLLSSTYQCLVY